MLKNAHKVAATPICRNGARYIHVCIYTKVLCYHPYILPFTCTRVHIIHKKSTWHFVLNQDLKKKKSQLHAERK